ncbi:hypothetical protein Tco_0885667 [Tanacetum coccineum]
MLPLVHFVLVVLSAGIFLLLLFYFFYHPKPPNPITGPNNNENNVSNSKRQTNTNVGVSRKLFSWSDNPSLITDAVENGWSRFTFTDYIFSSSVRSKRFLLGSCAGDVTGGEDDVVEISWDVCQGSSDFMQKIRLNTGLNKIVKSTSLTMTAASVIKAALPLPGPTLGNSSPFPQEAYFEITIVSNYEYENGSDVNGKRGLNTGEGENIKLIQENGVVNVKGLHGNYEELRRPSCAKDIVEGQSEASIMLSVGLTGCGSLPARHPGSYPGSVGFNSDGSIHLDACCNFLSRILDMACSPSWVKMDDPNITMEEFIRLKEEKISSFEKEFPAIVYKDALTSEQEISSEPTVSYFNDFDYFKDFEKEFPAIAYNDALTTKLDFSETTVIPQHIDEFDETSLSECDDEGQNVIYFNDLFSFNVIYPDDLSDKDNDNDKIDIERSSGDLSIEPFPNVIKIDTQGSK